MRHGSRQLISVLRLVLALVFLGAITGCWIPLPEETAIVVEVFDARGEPVDGVRLILDGNETVVTGNQRDAGQVFKSLTSEGDHTLQLDTASLVDPQGGIGMVPLAYQISGNISALAFTNKPFVGSSDVLIVPVNKGEITVATFYLDDILKSPLDNQWLTDGSNASPYRPLNNVDEFRNNPEPTFWWRQDPSLSGTVTYIFQLWEDDDNDTRYPLRIAADPDNVTVGPARYAAAMDPSSAGYVQPDWQVPLAGIQRAEAASTVNQIVIWSSQATDISTPVDYDLYYAPTSQWNSAVWERNAVLRDIQGTPDSTAMRFALGAATANDGIVLKNGTEYTFALKARDGVSNLDTSGSTSTRKAVPKGSAANLGGVANLSAVADSTVGGSIDLVFDCTPNVDLRIYAAPSTDFNSRPFDARFIRDIYTCVSSTDNYSLSWLVNGVTYAVGVEPFDALGNVGTASSVRIATPSSAAAGDTTAPTIPTLSVTHDGNGQVTLNLSAVADSDVNVFRRVYWTPVSFTSSDEAMMFTDLGPSAPLSLILTDIPNNIPYHFRVRGIDSSGNSSVATTQFELTETDNVGPTWASDDPSFFSTVAYAPISTTKVWDMGATWKYSGFALGQDPGEGKGEYVWRVLQNGSAGVPVPTKLGVLYTYSGYYYASTESGSLDMSQSGPWQIGGGPTDNADHRDVFSFVESAISSADVMGAPFDSTDSAGYRQRTAAQFLSSLVTGSSATNQLTILYNTDEDGEAVVSQISTPTAGFAGILRVLPVRKQTPLPTPEPHLQGKEFQLSYYDASDGLVSFPPPLPGNSIFYFGTLGDPDFEDPLW